MALMAEDFSHVHLHQYNAAIFFNRKSYTIKLQEHWS
jgi:hypothetical protein